LNRLKVCILSLDSPLYGGGTIQAFRLALKLKALGAQPFMVFSLNRDSKSYQACYAKSYEEEVQAAGIPVYKKPEDMAGKWPSYKFYLKLFWQLRHEYQLVYIKGISRMLSWFVLFFKLLGKKVVIKMTGLGFNDPASLKQLQQYSWLRFKLLALADRFVGISSALCNAYRRSKLLPEAKLVQIPNGVDTTLFAPQPDESKKQRLKKELGLPLGDKIVTYVGGIKQAKGIDLLINTWEQVVKQYPKATLLIIGPLCLLCQKDEELFDSLTRKAGLYVFQDKKAVRLLRLSKPVNNIQVLGARENINEYLQASDVFVFLSRMEGMPNAVMEAMASGLPCVTLDIGEITGDLITHKELGYAIAGENIAAVTQAIVELLNDEAKCTKMGRAARQRMLQEFTIEKIAHRHYSLYQQLCS